MTGKISAYDASKRLGLDGWDFVNHVIEQTTPYQLVDGKLYFSLSDLESEEVSQVESESEIAVEPSTKPEKEKVVLPSEPASLEQPALLEQPDPLEEAAPLEQPASLEQPAQFEEAAPVVQATSLEMTLEEAEEQPEVEEPVVEEWLDMATYFLEDRLESCLKKYGDDHVKMITTSLAEYVGEEGARVIMLEDKKEQLLKLKGAGLSSYFGGLFVIQGQAEDRFGTKIPVKYDPQKSPANFLPSTIKRTGNDITREKKEAKTDLDINDICSRIGYSKLLVEGLVGEGHNIFYLEAMTIRNFDLNSLKPFMGKQFRFWSRNAHRALGVMGVPFNRRIWKQEEKLLRQIGLIYDGESKGYICFNKSWADRTQNQPHLNVYLSKGLPGRNGEGGEQ